jgi:hypothetical protein
LEVFEGVSERITAGILGWLKRRFGLAAEPQMQPPAEIAECELGTPGAANTLPSPAEAAAVCGLDALGMATTLTMLVETAVAMRKHGAANSTPRAEALPFNKAGSSLQPTGTKATTSASLLPAGVACGALGAHPGACAPFLRTCRLG